MLLVLVDRGVCLSIFFFHSLSNIIYLAFFSYDMYRIVINIGRDKSNVFARKDTSKDFLC